jgi:hypothetical protein
VDEKLAELQRRFRGWLAELDDGQLAVLAANWENIMNDAALDRVDSWVIARTAIAALHAGPP